MIHSCSHPREDLVLYHYDELGASARADMEGRLEACPACREQLKGLKALEFSVPRAPSVEIEDDVLSAIRMSTTRRLREEAVRPAARFRWMAWPFIPRLALALGAVVIVFFIGRLTASDSILPQVAAGLPSADVRISDISVNQETGIVQISWEESRPLSIQADLSDSRVQALLSQALMDESNPGGRLRAVRAVSQVEAIQAEPDPALTGALEGVLMTESNEGIRLQTLKALGSLHRATPISSTLKLKLIDMLTNERNPAIRIEVLSLLTNNELTSMELQDALQQARRDVNPFIRSQAEAVLAELESTKPLESVE
jgi:hypothetical protein